MPISPEETMSAAAIAGSTAATLIDHTPQTIWVKLSHWGAGCLVAVFGGPAIADFVEHMAKIESEHLRIGISLITGSCGKIALTKLVAVTNNLDLKELLTRIIGKPLS